jgi:hypothetical protein
MQRLLLGLSLLCRRLLLGLSLLCRLNRTNMANMSNGVVVIPRITCYDCTDITKPMVDMLPHIMQPGRPWRMLVGARPMANSVPPSLLNLQSLHYPQLSQIQVIPYAQQKGSAEVLRYGSCTSRPQNFYQWMNEATSRIRRARASGKAVLGVLSCDNYLPPASALLYTGSNGDQSGFLIISPDLEEHGEVFGFAWNAVITNK